MTSLTILLCNVLTVLINVGLLAITIKAYTEVLKARLINNIGKGDRDEENPVWARVPASQCVRE